MPEFKGTLSPSQIKSIDPRISQQHINGIAVVEYKGQDFYYPYRTENKGGKGEQGPNIWLWENPGEPDSELTLSPSIVEKEGGYTGSGETLFHIRIREGEVVEV